MTESSPASSPPAPAAAPKAGLRQLLKARYRPALLALASGTVVFVLMANQDQVPRGTLWGGLALALCVAAMLRTMGELGPRSDAIPLAETWLGAMPGERPWLSPLRALPGACALALGAAFVLGAGALPVAILLGLAWLTPAALKRPGLLVFVLVSLLYLPLLGAFGLWDPWETHYGEVAREILARDDWISLWWAQDKWFWSKPVFIFWAEALLWSASGIDYLPDSAFQHSEWVLRLPIFTIAMGAILAVYALVSRRFGTRAAVLSCIVLATTPYYGFLTHQAITDMPFVGQMTVAVMLLLLAVHEDPQRQVRSVRVGPFAVSLREVVLGLFLMLVLPQVLYLVTRNVTFIGGLFAVHPDEFMHGSGHNPDVPGNFAIRDQLPWSRKLWAQPMIQGLFWALCASGALFSIRRERRVRPLLMFAFYIFCGLAFMAKGIPGFALPGLVALLYLVGCSRFGMLFDGSFRIARGALVLLTVSMPWFVAMFIRHGPRFTDRLLVHDHLNRLTRGVHGDKGDIGYFIGQLGYGMFPWIALLPAALGGLALFYSREQAPDVERDRRREITLVLGLWFAATFTLFSAMATKFHHYIFPAVPPLAILTGVLLDELLGPPLRNRTRSWPMLALALLSPLPLVLGAAGLWGDVRGILPDGLSMGQRAVWALQNAWDPLVCLALLALGAVMLVAALRAYVVHHEPRVEEPSNGRGKALGAMLIAGALLCAFVGRDMAWTTAERPSGSERLIHLFVYNYDRPFPSHLDYRAIFTGFAAVATLLVVLAAVRALRPVMARSLVGLSLLFSLFCLNVYMLDLTPHWTQLGLVKRYYEERKGPQEPLLAWQMNWKGENYYTGNRVYVFVNLDNKKIKKWIDAQDDGSTAYVLLEHKRLKRFKKLLGSRKLEPRSTERDNNKFVLVKVTI
ncbi:MAG: glycosyltransferase family 39 protein [Myxococcales bacterium]|nr:glycosyltransferase family 39 protein [Myxococcales bacterium]